MNISQSHVQGVLVLRFSGRLDQLVADDADQQMASVLDTGHSRIVVDACDLDYISSAGLNVLIRASKRLRESDGRMAVCHLNEHVREVFERGGIADVIPILPDVDEAVACVSK